MSKIQVEMTVKEAKAWAGLQKIATAEGDVEKGMQKIGEAAKQVGKEHDELGRKAKRVYEQTRTPQERYNRKVKELDHLLKNNKISQDTYARSVAKAKQEMEGAGRAVRKTKTEMDAAGRAGNKAFGSGAIGQLATYAKGVLGISAAVGMLKTAWNKAHEARTAAAEKQREAFHGLGSLAQLAETPEEMRKLTGMARDLYKQGGARSLDEAGRTVFSIISARAGESADLFGKLTGRGLISDPAAMIGAQKTLIASMGKEETGGFRELASKAFGASKYTPATVEALLSATAKSGTSAYQLGMGDEEILAATALVSEAKGSAEEGGTYMAQMMRTLKQKGEFKGKSLAESLRMIEAKGLNQADLKTWFGRAQGQEAYEVLVRQLPLYEKALADVRTAEKEDRVAAKLKLFEADPVIQAVMERRQAEAGEELGLEEDATWEQKAQTVRSELRKTNRKQVGSLLTSVVDTLRAAEHYVVGPKVFAEKSGGAGKLLGVNEDGVGLNASDVAQLGDSTGPLYVAADTSAESIKMLAEATGRMVIATENLERMAAGGATLRQPNDEP